MGTNLSNLNISDKDTDTINTKNCCKPFTEELWRKECINSLERSAENGDKVAMFNTGQMMKNRCIKSQLRIGTNQVSVLNRLLFFLSLNNQYPDRPIDSII
ncbi:uncharacterized protein OCT59_017745 [Rhizophagus irregularis]|uniref:uncharacterized protein n=1 Tax=Rhizophagus irregularis TaxID=588596 RepID=UPI000CB9CD3B|nr:hypothetical protein OCT59_017745 [Rhizophagus irregularis]GBC46683.1 kinase-like domain-containing protein [Rhizophagus irregularis DAOM 181602=DAOM 197198]